MHKEKQKESGKNPNTDSVDGRERGGPRDASVPVPVCTQLLAGTRIPWLSLAPN